MLKNMNRRRKMAGILYVVFNKWINNPETKKMPYKIGITSGTVEDRYYGLGLKMPGEFETLFAYLIEDYKQAEVFFQNIFKQYNNNGEWFDLEQKQLDLFKLNCEEMGGIDVKDRVEIKKDSIQKSRNTSLAVNKKNGTNDIGKSISSDIIKEEKNELENLNDFFQNEGFEMKGVHRDFNNGFYIYGILKRSSRARSKNLIFAMGTKHDTTGYKLLQQVKIETNDEDDGEIGNLRSYLPRIKELFSEACPGRNRSPSKASIIIPFIDPKKEIINILKQIKPILKF
jgi:hypothetical protein